MNRPLVTIIGLSYNQAEFIPAALDSISAQTYPNLQVILADDASTDNSAEVLQKYAARQPGWQILLLKENLGNTRAFNKAFAHARGAYIIDFALDDVMHPERVEQQVQAFEKLDNRYGIIYTEAELIDAPGRLLGSFYDAIRGKSGLWPPPQGDVFEIMLRRSFISTPTMMIRKQVLDELNGYDESLYYEDFDFWVRSSRNWRYHFLDLPLTKKRIWPESMSQKFYRANQHPFHQSTLQVCRKAVGLVNTEEEKNALAVRLRFQAKQAYVTGHPEEVQDYKELLTRIHRFSASDALFFALYSLPLPLSGFYRLYHKLMGRKLVT